MKKYIAIQVYGKVQGVWFRASTKAKAEELGLLGSVQNKADGSVYIETYGTIDVLEIFQTWCTKGPEFARVDRIKIEDLESKKFHNFSILR